MVKNSNFVYNCDDKCESIFHESCRCCTLYKCDIINQYDMLVSKYSSEGVPQYIFDELKKRCMLEGSRIECGPHTVSDGIGDSYKIELNHKKNIIKNTDKWEPRQPVFISVQTGGGKTYFAENILAQYIRDLNHQNRTNFKILIISNRKALKKQIENRVNNRSQPIDDDTIYTSSEYIDVINYQSILTKAKFLKNKQKNTTSRYLYVICDEAHFFTSDALFNSYTRRILSTIISIFYKCIRVYMSATPYEVLEYINEFERSHFHSLQRQHLGSVLYHFERNYDCLDIKYYSEHNELYELIHSSVIARNEKWLIFIDNKSKCSIMVL